MTPMKRLPLLLLILSTAILWADVALIYGTWGDNTYKGEFDETFKALGDKVEKFTNEQIEELTARLPEFDLVVLGSVGNLENTITLAPFASQWEEFIQNGGIVFVADANYPSSTSCFLNQVSGEFRVDVGLCSSHTNPCEETSIAIQQEHPLQRFPNEVQKHLRDLGHWSHLVPKKANGWIVLEKCYDNHSLTLVKFHGRGAVCITVHAGLSGAAPRLFGQNLIANIRIMRSLREAGVELLSAEIPSAEAPRHIELTIANTSPDIVEKLSPRLCYQQGDDVITVPLAIDNRGEEIHLSAYLEYPRRGKWNFNLILADAEDEMGETSWSIELPPVLASSIKRRHLYPGNDILRVETTLLPDTSIDSTWALHYTIDEKPPVIVPEPNLQRLQELDVSGLQPGSHRLVIRCLQGESTMGETSEEFFVHDSPISYIDGNGMLVNQGKPTFPLGFYHVSWSASDDQRQSDILSLAEAGYNTAVVGFKRTDMDTGAYGRLLDACRGKGIFLITEFDYPRIPILSKYGKHPAVLGWYNGDEPDGNGISAEDFALWYEELKTYDPQHIAYAVLCQPSSYKSYSSSSDVMAPDIYPVGNGNIDSVLYGTENALRESSKYGIAQWIVCQCFGGYGNFILPTPAQFRSQAYLGVMGGAKGILYYCIYDSSFYLKNHEELWKAVQAFPAEFNALVPYLLESSPNTLANNQGGIHAAEWQGKDGTRALVVVNASEDDVKYFRFEGDYADARLMFGEVEELTDEGGVISGGIPPQERAVFFVAP